LSTLKARPSLSHRIVLKDEAIYFVYDLFLCIELCHAICCHDRPAIGCPTWFKGGQQASRARGKDGQGQEGQSPIKAKAIQKDW
jgi:hypothetical protein